MASRGMVWVDYEIVFKADEDAAKAAHAFMQTLDIESYDYPVGDEIELYRGQEDGTWVITYGAESWTEGPCNDLNAKFPELKAVAHCVGEHYD